MLRFLLDENISPAVATGLMSRRPDSSIVSVHGWRGGTLVGQPDHLVLEAATEDGLTLVTFDCRTIPTLLTEWWVGGRQHAGVILVDERTIRPRDFGGVIRALEFLWIQRGAEEWRDRIHQLQTP